MKKLLLAAATILLANPVFAQTYRPFTYTTPCALETKDEFLMDNCKVVETREKDGALRTRNIYSNRFGLTIKGRFDKEKGYIQTDSYNKFEYQWQYKVGGAGWTMVMPSFYVENISWD